MRRHHTHGGHRQNVHKLLITTYLRSAPVPYWLCTPARLTLAADNSRLLLSSIMAWVLKSIRGYHMQAARRAFRGASWQYSQTRKAAPRTRNAATASTVCRRLGQHAAAREALGRPALPTLINPSPMSP